MLRYSTIPELERQLPTENESREDHESPLSMLHDRVTSDDIARVVAKSTGIPVQNLLKGERDKLVHVRIRTTVLIPFVPLLTFGVDGEFFETARCWTRSCCDRCQRCSPDITRWVASSKPAHCFLPVPRTHRRREGMLAHCVSLRTRILI